MVGLEKQIADLEKMILAPCAILVYGVTGVGKSTFVKQVLPLSKTVWNKFTPILIRLFICFWAGGIFSRKPI